MIDSSTMKITVTDRDGRLRERLRDRLDLAAGLLCAEHGQPPAEVTLHDREHGWFDSHWVTCCEQLEQQAVKIVRERC